MAAQLLGEQCCGLARAPCEVVRLQMHRRGAHLYRCWSGQQSRTANPADFCIVSRTCLVYHNHQKARSRSTRQVGSSSDGTAEEQGEKAARTRQLRTGRVELRNAPFHQICVWAASVELLLATFAHPALARSHVVHGLHANHSAREPAPTGPPVQRLLVRRDPRRAA